ncbi:alpha-1,2-fucosyltransferase [Pedobacter hiemivivus]|uniref:Alpha-1,2-fucosyltransferase n=1 Tax=Pedobacter hiemivivus TaxID=2530454 RepID=A0A4U1G4V4_9SPHI|nr:alpha-1,2-fucosyltransferase [Pedobacter hiemivivus]TKC55812.1 alpha-1,2-fucosyltransferase [Pedobacter hiemivivus]
MKIVKFLGGLGNQMFQYAFYRALSKRHKTVKADLSGYSNYPLHNGFELEKIFNLDLKKASPFIIKLYDPTVRTWYIRKLRKILLLEKAYKAEKDPFLFDEEKLKDKGPKLYWGYWQNQKYFIDIEQELRANFQFKNEVSKTNENFLQQILRSNSISVHIRRGDYVGHESLGGLCDLAYYREAITIMRAKIKTPSFFIFSDDMEWCRKNLPLPENTTLIEGNNGLNSYIDMQLMSNCKHNIIANSSFSWWAAWLNQNPDKIVIAPKKWINDDNYNDSDIIPKTWLKI